MSVCEIPDRANQEIWIVTLFYDEPYVR